MQLRAVVLVVVIVGSVTMSGGGVIASESPEYGTVTGGAIELHPKLESQYLSIGQEFASQLGIKMRDNAFKLLADGRTYIVFSDKKPKTGRAKVSGKIVKADSDIGLIFADSVAVTTKGTKTDISEIEENPAKYHGRLVRVTTSYRQLSYLFEAGDGQYVAKQSVASAGSSFPDPRLQGVAARAFAGNISQVDSFRGRQYYSMISAGTTPYVIDQNDQRFWIRGRVTADIVVQNVNGTPWLHLASLKVYGKDIKGVQAAQQQVDQLQGKVVTFSAQVIGSRISTQETLLKVAKCAPESVTVPGAGCIPMPADTVVHAGVLFSGTPTTVNDVLFYVGVSNRHQKQPVTKQSGSYQVTGRLVSTDQIDPDLPNGYALIVYEMQRKGNLQASGTTQQRIEQWSGTVQSQFVNQFQGKTSGQAVNLPTTTPTPTLSPTQKPSEGNDGQSSTRQSEDNQMAEEQSDSTQSDSSILTLLPDVRAIFAFSRLGLLAVTSLATVGMLGIGMLHDRKMDKGETNLSRWYVVKRGLLASVSLVGVGTVEFVFGNGGLGVLSMIMGVLVSIAWIGDMALRRLWKVL